MLAACPYCNSGLVFKAGFRSSRLGERIQRYLCRSCGRRFSESLNNLRARCYGGRGWGENSPSSVETMNPAETGAMSVLVQQPGAAQDKAKELEGTLISFAWWLKKQGRAEMTIEKYLFILRNLARYVDDIENPEGVKEALARLNKSGSWKRLAIACYSSFLKMRGKHWDPPKVIVARKLPFIPQERELDDLIAGCGPKLSVLLQLLKETGMRIGEALRLTWSSIDLERKVIILNQPEKNSNSRIFKISDSLIGKLNLLPRKGERLFQTTQHSLRSNFLKQRKKLAKKLNNPRLLNITFHTFRHWKATMEYHRTKDIIHVKELLGHKDVEKTMLYIQIEKSLFNSESDEFTVRVAKDPNEIKELLEAGFEYVCEHDGLKFFRRRK